MPINQFPNCYWVLPNQFLAGEYPGDLTDDAARAKIEALHAAGVTAIIDLTGENDGLRPYAHLLPAGIHYQRFAIPDYSIPASPNFTRNLLDAIDAHLAAGRVVYIHCWGGVGRTGTIVGCWLARQAAKDQRPAPGQVGLNRLQELWRACPKSAKRVSPETDEQARYILNWQEL